MVEVSSLGKAINQCTKDIFSSALAEASSLLLLSRGPKGTPSLRGGRGRACEG